jgi:hypothetical protein
MRHTTYCLKACCMLLLASACAQSVHQTERLTRSDFGADLGYAGDQYYSYWPGPGYGAGYGIGYGAGYWGTPLGYYGYPYGPFGFGSYRGYRRWSGMRQPGGSLRPMSPAHVPPQFKKKS